jgi:hypothetical protein
MPLVKKTRGSGITKETVLSVSAERTGLTAEDQALVIRGLQAAALPFFEKLAATEARAARTLAKARLPTESGLLFRYSLKTGKWQTIAGAEPSKPGFGVSREIALIVKASGFDWDSPESYAARILDTACSVRNAVTAGDVGYALWQCCCLGRLLTEERLKAGRADGPSRGGKKRWPLAEPALYEEYRAAYQAARSRGFSIMQSYEKAGAANGVGARTIRTAVTGK